MMLWLWLLLLWLWLLWLLLLWLFLLLALRLLQLRWLLLLLICLPPTASCAPPAIRNGRCDALRCRGRSSLAGGTALLAASLILPERP